MTTQVKQVSIGLTGSVTVNKVTDRLMGFVMHDEQVWGESRPEHNDAPVWVEGLPETVRLEQSVSLGMTKAMQAFWFALLKRSAPNFSEAELLSGWRGLTKSGVAFTDGCSWSNGRADYIQGINLDAKQPMAINTIICGGATVSILDNGALYSIDNTLCYKIAMLNVTTMSLDVNAINHDTRPDLVFYATVSRRDKTVIKFPQLGGDDVPVPLFSLNDYGYIQADRIQLLPVGSVIPSPYVHY